MAHIDLGPASRLPGIRGLLEYRRDSGAALGALADVLLRGPSPLSRGERELIAAYVSALNGCAYCRGSHGAAAAAQLDGRQALVDAVLADPGAAPVTPLLRSLLAIAAAVNDGGHRVDADLVATAQGLGGSDAHVHDTVLIAAAFAMFNRYVDGLGTHAPDDQAAYAQGAARIVEHGYGLPPAPGG